MVICQTVEKLLAIGCKIGGAQLDNGEVRHSFMLPDRTGYEVVRAAPDEGEWQAAHYHKGLFETCVVQDGWVAFASRDERGNRVVTVCFEGEVFTLKPGTPHNLYMSSGAVTHTVMHGVSVGPHGLHGDDWYSAEAEFSEWSKSLTRQCIANQMRSPRGSRPSHEQWKLVHGPILPAKHPIFPELV